MSKENPLTVIKSLIEQRDTLTAQIEKIRKLLGVVSPPATKGQKGMKPKPKKPRKPKTRVDPEAILAFIGTGEKSIKDVVDHIGASRITVSKVLDELTKDKKLQFRKDGTSKLFKKR